MCTRRHFLGMTGMAALFGPALLEESLLAAAQARAAEAVSPAGAGLFDLEKVAEGVYAAIARPQLLINSNACIVVMDEGVLVVDTHSKPSAARALISQIRREVTEKPVKYIVNTHFHWDHAQGNHAYPSSFPGVEIVSSVATKQLLVENGKSRLQESLAGIPKQIEELRRQLEKADDAQTRATLTGLIAQAEAYQKEMENVEVDLPTRTFSDTLVLGGKNREAHLLILGRGHTSGDVVVHLPRERVVATGDLAHGFLPYIGDGYPTEWPITLDRLRRLDFSFVAPGHGAVQKGKAVLGNFRDYLEELTGLVRAGKEKGQSVEALQKQITPDSLKSLRSPAYLDLLRANYQLSTPTYKGAPPALESGLAGNIADVYKRLEAK